MGEPSETSSGLSAGILEFGIQGLIFVGLHWTARRLVLPVLPNIPMVRGQAYLGGLFILLVILAIPPLVIAMSGNFGDLARSDVGYRVALTRGLGRTIRRTGAYILPFPLASVGQLGGPSPMFAFCVVLALWTLITGMALSMARLEAVHESAHPGRRLLDRLAALYGVGLILLARLCRPEESLHSLFPEGGRLIFPATGESVIAGGAGAFVPLVELPRLPLVAQGNIAIALTAAALLAVVHGAVRWSSLAPAAPPSGLPERAPAGLAAPDSAGPPAGLRKTSVPELLRPVDPVTVLILFIGCLILLAVNFCFVEPDPGREIAMISTANEILILVLVARVTVEIACCWGMNRSLGTVYSLVAFVLAFQYGFSVRGLFVALMIFISAFFVGILAASFDRWQLARGEGVFTGSIGLWLVVAAGGYMVCLDATFFKFLFANPRSIDIPAWCMTKLLSSTALALVVGWFSESPGAEQVLGEAGDETGEPPRAASGPVSV